MPLLLHQFKTDARHYRGWLIALWGSFALHALLPLSPLHDQALVILGFLLLLLQGLAALFTVACCVQADPLVGSNAFWMARPITRRTVFWSKTAFIVLLLGLPHLAAVSVSWAVAGFSAHQCLLAAVETVGKSFGFLFLGAALAALTKDLAHFLAAAGLACFGFFISGFLAEFAVRFDLLPNVVPRGMAVQSALLVALSVLVVSIALAWLLQALAGKWRASVAALSFGIVLCLPVVRGWNVDFLSRPRVLNPDAKVALLRDNEPAGTAQSGQILWSHFRVSGLRSNEVAVVSSLHGGFQPKAGPPIALVQSIHDFSGWRESSPLDSDQHGDYLKAIRNFYPPGTLWFSAFPSHARTTLPVGGQVPEEYRRQPPRGVFRATLGLDFVEAVRVAELPLAPASVTFRPGERLTLRRVTPRTDGIRLDIRLTAASLLLSRDERTSGLGVAWRWPGALIFVLYHPALGEAYTYGAEPHPTYLPVAMFDQHVSVVDHLVPYPALRARLTGVPTENWLREARLHVYMAQRRSSSRHSIHVGDYTFRLDRSDQLRASAADNRATFRDATLSAGATAAELRAYLELVLETIPDNWRGDEFPILQQKLTAVGAAGLPELIRRWPVEPRAQAVVRDTIKRLAAREHLPALREALRRDPRLVDLFVAKQWEADVRDIVLEQLRDRRRPLPPDALLIAASVSDPAMYADLAWHFARLPHGHDRVAQALAKCPGFDLAPAVREAWKRARLDLATKNVVAPLAAAEGLPEALDTSILLLESDADASWLERLRTRLGELTGSPKRGKELQDWLLQNAGRFRFDPAARRYSLAGPP